MGLTHSEDQVCTSGGGGGPCARGHDANQCKKKRIQRISFEGAKTFFAVKKYWHKKEYLHTKLKRKKILSKDSLGFSFQSGSKRPGFTGKKMWYILKGCKQDVNLNSKIAKTAAKQSGKKGTYHFVPFQKIVTLHFLNLS